MTELRFAVTSSATGRISATWKLWSVGKDEDVYLACRELGTNLHVSLHQSGQWHVRLILGDERRQTIPTKLHTPNWRESLPIVGVRIHTPDDAITREHPKGGKKLALFEILDAADEGEDRLMTEFLVVICGSDLVEHPDTTRGLALVGCIKVSDEIDVALLARRVPHQYPRVPDEHRMTAYVLGEAEDVVRPGARVLVWGSGDDGAIGLYDSRLAEAQGSA